MGTYGTPSVRRARRPLVHAIPRPPPRASPRPSAGQHMTTARRLDFWEEFLIGGAAAAVSKTAAAPIERVKLMVQNQNEMMKSRSIARPYRGVADCFRRVYAEEGVLPFWRGNVPNVLRSPPGGHCRPSPRLPLHSSAPVGGWGGQGGLQTRPPPPFAPTSRQRSALIWFALQCNKSKQCTESRTYDHRPVSRGYMRAQYLLLMALCPPPPLSSDWAEFRWPSASHTPWGAHRALCPRCAKKSAVSHPRQPRVPGS